MACEECKSLRSVILRLMAYLSAFIKMCDNCFFPEKVCQCAKRK